MKQVSVRVNSGDAAPSNSLCLGSQSVHKNCLLHYSLSH